MIFPIAPVFLLLLMALFMLGVRLYKRAFQYYWLIAAAGALMAWIMLFVFRERWSSISFQFPFISSSTLTENLSFNFDQSAWFFALISISLFLSTLMTGLGVGEVQESAGVPWGVYPLFLVFAALCALAGSAANLVLFQILWLLMDAVELAMWVTCEDASTDQKSLVARYGLKTLSHMMLITAAATALALENSTDWPGLPVTSVWMIIIAGGLRFGVVPPYHLPPINITHKLARPILFIASNAPAVILLSRTPPSVLPSQTSQILIAFSALAILSAGFSWLGRSDITSAPAYWVQGIGTLMVVAVVNGQSDSAYSWGFAMLLIGGIIFEGHLADKKFRLFLWLSAAFLACLPFTLTWAGARLYTQLGAVALIFIFGQSMLIAGLVRFSLRKPEKSMFAERWILPLYGLGLVLLAAVSIYAGLSFPSPTTGIPNITPENLDLLLPGLLIIGFSFILLLLIWTRSREVIIISSIISKALDFGWLYRILSIPISLTNRLLRLTNLLLEGQAEIIWAVLMLVLLITLLQQTGFGG